MKSLLLSLLLLLGVSSATPLSANSSYVNYDSVIQEGTYDDFLITGQTNYEGASAIALSSSNSVEVPSLGLYYKTTLAATSLGRETNTFVASSDLIDDLNADLTLSDYLYTGGISEWDADYYGLPEYKLIKSSVSWGIISLGMATSTGSYQVNKDLSSVTLVFDYNVKALIDFYSHVVTYDIGAYLTGISLPFLRINDKTLISIRYSEGELIFSSQNSAFKIYENTDDDYEFSTFKVLMANDVDFTSSELLFFYDPIEQISSQLTGFKYLDKFVDHPVIHFGSDIDSNDLVFNPYNVTSFDVANKRCTITSTKRDKYGSIVLNTSNLTLVYSIGSITDSIALTFIKSSYDNLDGIYYYSFSFEQDLTHLGNGEFTFDFSSIDSSIYSTSATVKPVFNSYRLIATPTVETFYFLGEQYFQGFVRSTPYCPIDIIWQSGELDVWTFHFYSDSIFSQGISNIQSLAFSYQTGAGPMVNWDSSTKKYGYVRDNAGNVSGTVTPVTMEFNGNFSWDLFGETLLEIYWPSATRDNIYVNHTSTNDGDVVQIYKKCFWYNWHYDRFNYVTPLEITYLTSTGDTVRSVSNSAGLHCEYDEDGNVIGVYDSDGNLTDYGWVYDHDGNGYVDSDGDGVPDESDTGEITDVDDPDGNEANWFYQLLKLLGLADEYDNIVKGLQIIGIALLSLGAIFVIYKIFKVFRSMKQAHDFRSMKKEIKKLKK